MKFVDRAQTALTEGAAQVAAAANKASTVLSSGLAGALVQGQEAVSRVGSEFAEITRQLGTLATPLNPQGIVSDLASALSSLQTDLQAIPA